MSHPVHPMVVHFPIACWSLGTLGDLVSIIYPDKLVYLFSGIMLVIGTLVAIAAMITGLIEYGKIKEEDQAMSVANKHMKFVMVAWSFYASSLFMRLEGTNLALPDTVDILLSIAGFISLSIAGWLGGKLVYEHRIGIS